MAAAALEVRELTVRYGAPMARSFCALDRASFTAEAGRIFGLLGPSGCGKSTALKAISGLLEPEAGEVVLGGRNLAGVPPHRRGIGMVFQSYALFPHLDVAGNLAFGLRMHGVPRRERERRVARALELVRIAELATARPDQLSGGQQQRVALARTLAVEPSLLLLDEPLSALDRQLRQTMRAEIGALLRGLGITAVVVTHDQEEAMTLCERVAVMRAGRIEQIGAPRALYLEPRNRFVASFMGRANILEGTASRGGEGLLSVGLGEAGAVTLPHDGAGRAGGRAVFMVRPESVALTRAGAAPPGHNLLPAIVARVEFLGERTLVAARLRDGSEIESLIAGAAVPEPGTGVIAHWPIDATVPLDPEP